MNLFDYALPLSLAIFFGGLIGLERELSGKAAGLRTNVMICLGSAMFTLISVELGAGGSNDMGRIASQVVSGIGFLGAGSIIQDRGGVQGLTTAATIWLVASVGLACGAGFYGLALVCTVLALVILFGLGRLARKVQHTRKGIGPNLKYTEENDTNPE